MSSKMATDIFAELQGIQALLSGPAAAATAAAHRRPAPLPGPADDTEEEEEDYWPLPQRPPAARAVADTASQAAQVQDLQRQVEALRRQQAEGEDKRQRLQEALQAAHADGELVAHRRLLQLQGKQEESIQLANLVFQLREEADSLRQQLQCSTHQAEHNDTSALASIAQLQQAAGEWRRQGEDSLELLAEEQARSASLQHELQRLQQHAGQQQRELEEVRQQRQAAAAELATLKAAVGSPAGSAALVGELKQRLQMERSWRKAVCQWLQMEMQTKNDLERVLVNVGTAVRVGEVAHSDNCSSRRARQAAVPPLPPRRVAASQLAQGAAARTPAMPAAASGVTVSVHSPRATVTVTSTTSSTDSTGSGSAGKGRADWRQHFEATMQAFDERHGRLQQELSALRREDLQPAA